MAGTFPGLYLKRGWYYYQPPGSRLDRPKAIALKTKDFLEAVGRATEEGGKAMLTSAAKRMTLEEILPQYFRDKHIDAKSSRANRKVILNGFKDILGNPRVDQLNKDMIETWRLHLHEKGGTPNGRGPVSTTTMKSYLINVKAFIAWALEKRYLTESPLGRLAKNARVKGKTKRHEFHTELEREKMLQVRSPLHIELILLLGYLHGLRFGEMLAATTAWIWIAPDCSQGTISVQDTPITFKDGSSGWFRPKGRRRREIRMHPRLLAFFKKHPPEGFYLLRPDLPLWPNDNKQSHRYDGRKALATLSKKAGVEKMNYHIMRHSFATHLAMKGVSMAEIAALLGDLVSVTEETYVGFSPSRKNPVELL